MHSVLPKCTVPYSSPLVSHLFHMKKCVYLSPSLNYLLSNLKTHWLSADENLAFDIWKTDNGYLG